MLWLLKIVGNKYLLGGVAVLAAVTILGLWVYNLGKDSRQDTIDNLKNKVVSYQIQVSSMQTQIEFSENLHLEIQELKGKYAAQIAAINKVATSIPRAVTTTYNVNNECVPSEEFSKIWNQLNRSR